MLNWPLVRWLEAAYSKAEVACPGWELGVITSIAVTICTLQLHIIFLAVAWKRSKPRPDGLGTLWEGEFNAVDWVNKIAHAIINLLSTVSTNHTCSSFGHGVY